MDDRGWCTVATWGEGDGWMGEWCVWGRCRVCGGADDVEGRKDKRAREGRGRAALAQQISAHSQCGG